MILVVLPRDHEHMKRQGRPTRRPSLLIRGTHDRDMLIVERLRKHRQWTSDASGALAEAIDEPHGVRLPSIGESRRPRHQLRRLLVLATQQRLFHDNVGHEAFFPWIGRIDLRFYMDGLRMVYRLALGLNPLSLKVHSER
jgi:hypothetical protein